MLSPRASALTNVTRNLFASQAIQNGEASETPRDDALGIEPEPPIQVPDAADEAPPANRTVTFALDLLNNVVAAAPVAPMQGTRSRTAGTSSHEPPLPPLPPLEPPLPPLPPPEPPLPVPDAALALEPPANNLVAANDDGGIPNQDAIALPWQDFTRLRVIDLKEQCRMRGLPVSGRKHELIGRLNHYHGVDA